MKYLTVFFLIIVLHSTLFAAQSLSLSIKVEPEEVLLGVPLTITLTLESQDSFTLHGPLALCDEHTKVVVKDSSGNPTDIVAIDCGDLVASRNPIDSDAKKTYDGLATVQDEFFLPTGTFLISAEYQSIGPYLDRYSETDVRPVEGIWTGELKSNEVKVTVETPEGEDQNAFSALRSAQEELPPPENELSWFLKLKSEQILQDYPKSNYAAWVLWKKGEANYTAVLSRSLSVEQEFDYKAELEEIESTLSAYPCGSRKELLGVIDNWARLTEDFPNFPKRPEVLKGLAQSYIRIGEHQKAIPPIKELLEKHSETESAKKVAAYKDWMQQKKVWN